MKTLEQVEEETIQRCVEQLRQSFTFNDIISYVTVLDNIERLYKTKKSCVTCAIGVSKCYKTIQCARGKYSEWKPIQN